MTQSSLNLPKLTRCHLNCFTSPMQIACFQNLIFTDMIVTNPSKLNRKQAKKLFNRRESSNNVPLPDMTE